MSSSYVSSILGSKPISSYANNCRYMNTHIHINKLVQMSPLTSGQGNKAKEFPKIWKGSHFFNNKSLEEVEFLIRCRNNNSTPSEQILFWTPIWFHECYSVSWLINPNHTLTQTHDNMRGEEVVGMQTNPCTFTCAPLAEAEQPWQRPIMISIRAWCEPIGQPQPRTLTQAHEKMRGGEVACMQANPITLACAHLTKAK